jgi:hypothetical protein
VSHIYICIVGSRNDVNFGTRCDKKRHILYDGTTLALGLMDVHIYGRSEPPICSNKNSPRGERQFRTLQLTERCYFSYKGDSPSVRPSLAFRRI